MSSQKFLDLFQNQRLQLVFEAVEPMLRPLALHPGAFRLPRAAFKLDRDHAFQLIDRPVALRAVIEAEAEVMALGGSLGELFDPATVCSAEAGGRLATLRFAGEIGLETDFATTGGQLTLSARASATGRVEYRHLVAMPPDADTTLLDALAHLAKTTRLPGQMTLGGSRVGSIDRWSALLVLDFGIAATYGKKFQLALQENVFEGLPAALQISGEVTARAALGLELYERMVLTVGRCPGATVETGWLRVRIEREHRDRLSFGATVALQAKWDLGSSLQAILDKAFDQIRPLPRAVQTLDNLSRELTGPDGWEAFKTSVSAQLAGQLSEWLDDTGWQSWLASDERVGRLLATSRDLVAAYRKLGPRLQSWWNHFLDGADLGASSKVRQWLDRVADLDLDHLDLDALLTNKDSKLAGVVDWIETFTGHSLDEILLAPEQKPRRFLEQAVAEARKARRFLDDMAPHVSSHLQGYARRTGIAGIIDFLAANATSPEKVQGFVSERIRGFAARLVDKAFDQLTAADVRKIQSWAERVQKVLQAPAELHADLVAAVQKLEGDLGFSLALEIDRVSSRTALIDVEIDPSKSHEALHDNLEQALRRGSVGGMLQALDEHSRALTQTDDTGAEPRTAERPFPFLLRECTFTSRKVRTSAVQTLLNLSGLGKTFSASQKSIDERVQETSFTASQTAGENGPVFRRAATYAGGYTRTEIHNKTTDRTGVWIGVEEGGSGLAHDGGFDDPAHPEVELRLSYFREDAATGPSEIRAIAGVLTELGFAPHGNTDVDEEIAAALPNEAGSRLSIALRLPATALDAWLADLRPQTWDEPFLKAARRWLDEKTTFVAFPELENANRGEVLEAITRCQDFLEKWKAGSRDFAQEVGTSGLSMRVGTAIKNVKLFQSAQLVYRSPFLPLKTLIDRRAPGLAHQKKIAKALADARQNRTPADYHELIAAAALGWHRTHVASGSWPSSTFPLWLLIARLTEVAPAALESVTGVALLRTRLAGTDTWGEPIGWRLHRGLHAMVAGM